MAFWSALLFAFVMAVVPNPPEVVLDTPDTFQHILAFVTLTLLASSAWPATSYWQIGLRLSAFGALIEMIQLIPSLHRDGDLWDWIADTGAILSALALSGVVRHIRNGRDFSRR